MRGERIKGRAPDLWATYMHGIVDFFGTVIPWTEQFLPGQNIAEQLDHATTISGNPYRRSPLPSLRLDGGRQLITGIPLVAGDDYTALAGKTIRVFVWMRGEQTGENGDLWTSAPRMDVLIVESGGYSVVVHRGPMATRGTFPWHCYVSDVEVPTSAMAMAEIGAARLLGDIDRERGIYLRLINPDSGTAWFSTLSWEPVDETSTYTSGEKQDPLTGSLAPNARYDELPVHLCSRKVLHRGLLPAYEWAFLAGTKRGALNVPDVLSRAGFDQYLQESALQDSHHFVNGLTRLAEWYHAGTQFKTLPPAEGGWLEYVGTRVAALQDVETGFWGTERTPLSMGLSARVVERLFGAVSIARADRAPVRQPWLSCGREEVPRRDAIVKTVLSMQCLSSAAEGGPGAWSTVAYHHATPEDMELDASCDLAATSNAIYLLRRCSQGLDENLETAVEEAVRRAMRRVWATCLLPTGLWKQNSHDSRATYGAFMDRLMDASPMLERRVNAALPAAEVEKVGSVEDGRLEIAWSNPTDGVVSLRVYAALKDVAPESLTDAHLVGVVQSSNGDARALDPLVLLRLMRMSAEDAWGMTWFAGHGGYTEWKLAQLPDPLVTSLDGEPIMIALRNPAAMNVFVSTTNWYGETSPPVLVPFKVPAAEDRTVFDEDGEDEAATNAGGQGAEADGADDADDLAPAPW